MSLVCNLAESCQDAFAQPDSLKTDSECWSLYEKSKTDKDHSPLYYSRKIREIARGNHDLASENLADYIDLLYYINDPDDEKKFLNTLDRYQQNALAIEDHDAYFEAYTININRLLASNRTISAFNEISSMLSEAIEKDSPSGYWSGYMSMATICEIRHDTLGVRYCLSEALKHYSNGPTQSYSEVMTRMAETYSHTDSTLLYLNMAAGHMTSTNDSLNLYKSLSTVYARKSDYSSYSEAKANYFKVAGKSVKTSPDRWFFEYFDSIFKGDFVAAKNAASHISDKLTRLSYIRNVALMQKDYKEAYSYFSQIQSYSDSLSSTVLNSQLSEMIKSQTSLVQKTRLQEDSEVMISRQRTNLYILIFGGFFIILFIVVDFAMFYIKQKNESINRQKALTESLQDAFDQSTRLRLDAEKSREEAVKAMKLAEKANEMKTTFVQNMSHEIRTPLNAIVGFSQLMSLPEGFLTEDEKQQYGRYILANSNLLTMLIDDILNINEVESGNYRINVGTAGCNDICRQAMNSVEYRVPPGVDYTFSSEADDNFCITTDERRVRQVLINFLTNACKHTEKGRIHIQCNLSKEDNSVVFSVSDTGTGIPAEKAEAIFDRFTKLDSFKQGAGLGLNICRIIAEKLGGSVKLDTSYTDGAKFDFKIPVKIVGEASFKCDPLA